MSDLKRPEYKGIYAHLQKEQEAFLSHEAHFRGHAYKWPRDPLHCWSRIWEYPYVYYHLKSEKESLESKIDLKVIDLGSGATFFPFALAKLGYHVQCLDIDPICGCDLQRAILTVPHQPGKVDFSLISENRLPEEDDKVDVIYCISVLEHIPNFKATVKEIDRVLKPGGLFILTIDLDLCGYLDIGVEKYHDLRQCLARFFEIIEPEISIHPLDVLIQHQSVSTLQQLNFDIRQWIRMIRGKSRCYKYPNLAVWGAVMRKRRSFR